MLIFTFTPRPGSAGPGPAVVGLFPWIQGDTAKTGPPLCTVIWRLMIRRTRKELWILKAGMQAAKTGKHLIVFNRD